MISNFCHENFTHYWTLAYFLKVLVCIRLTMKGYWPLSTLLPPTILPDFRGTGNSPEEDSLRGTDDLRGSAAATWGSLRGTAGSEGKAFSIGLLSKKSLSLGKPLTEKGDSNEINLAAESTTSGCIEFFES
jgi:hypothetical protein